MDMNLRDVWLVPKLVTTEGTEVTGKPQVRELAVARLPVVLTVCRLFLIVGPIALLVGQYCDSDRHKHRRDN
jgi:hypothetical protein